MIIKFKTSKTPRYGQLLDYLTKDTNKILNRHGEALIIKQELYGKDNREMSMEFNEQIHKRIHYRSNNIMLTHEIISFSDLDNSKITIPVLKDLTEEYLRQRSPFMQAFAVAHFDKQYHVHILGNPVEVISNKNLRMSKSTFAKLKLHMQNYQFEKYPELTKSLVRHGKKEQERVVGKDLKNIKIRERGSSNSVKVQIREKIESLIISAKSTDNFYDLLVTENLTPYRRGNEWKGIIYNNKNYRLSTLIDDYSERYSQLDNKSKRIEELQEIRSFGNEKIHEQFMDYETSNPSIITDDSEENN